MEFIIAALILFGVGVYLLYALVIRPILKREADDSRRDLEQEAKQLQDAIRNEKENTARNYFGVELDPADQNHTHDEIVRIVSLLAYQTAVACVAQDEYIRSDKAKLASFNDAMRLEIEVSNRKTDWARHRKAALQIAPELVDRLPHFSEVEPLKSYNAENLLRKAKVQ